MLRRIDYHLTIARGSDSFQSTALIQKFNPKKTNDDGGGSPFDKFGFSAWWTGGIRLRSPLYENAISTKLELPYVLPDASWVLGYTESGCNNHAAKI